MSQRTLGKLLEPRRSLLPHAFAAVALILASGGLPAQDGEGDSEQEGERLNPLTSFHEAEKARLEEELEGAWLMTTLESEDEPFDELDFAGFAQFGRGFLTLILHGDEEVPSFFSGYETKLSVQAHVFRYRISDRGTLQAAGMMGFSNMNEDDELRFDGATNVAEYDLDIGADELRLRHPDGRHFRFRRLEAGAFPVHALDALRESRGSLSFDDPWEDDE